jgi:hypothetical protein
MWQNMRATKTFAKNPCPHINAELLLVSRMDYTMRILLCRLVSVLNIDAAASTERGPSVKYTGTKKWPALCLTTHRRNNY